MSKMEVRGQPAEFSVTPMQNVPLGLIKSKKLSSRLLDESQLAVYYACYRHLFRMIMRDSISDGRGNPVAKVLMASALNLGGWGLLRYLERLCKRRGVDIEKVKSHGIAA